MVLKSVLLWTAFLLGASYSSARAQEEEKLLQAGPMVGATDMREVKLWVQTTTSARVKIAYYETTVATVRYETAEVQTSKDKAYTAHLLADAVQPGRKYTYELFINGVLVKRPYPLTFQTLPLWQWRGDPPSFKVAVGSCLYVNEAVYDRPGRPYGAPYKVLTSIYEKKPDMMLWLGDNVYLREPDWNTRTGIIYRYTHTRSIAELQPLLGSTHHYAIPDDHDFGPNDADGSFWNKAQTTEVFKLFWANHAYGVHHPHGQGLTSYAEWGDVAFFLLDNRSFRSPNDRSTGTRTILGEEQLQWLINALVNSKATFKVIAIGGQVLNPVPVYENYSTYPEELSKLLSLIEQEKIKGVVFVDGDRHHTELSKLERRGTYPLYDFTISSITAGSDGRAEKEPNFLRVPGTFVGKNNFAIFEFSGAWRDRVLKCTVYDADGRELWTQSIRAKDLQ